MTEWLNVPVSKTGWPARVTGVRISPSPLAESPVVPQQWNHGLLHICAVLRITRLWRFSGGLWPEDSLRMPCQPSENRSESAALRGTCAAASGNLPSLLTYAGKRRRLPPYPENPFGAVEIVLR